ncbi:hypothetical protein HPB48_027091 [Haemaphysalis longicornis]|uniref:Tick transposon n=1 Tax=Haemaphysalis longicornis TaxID=44386 RepID=A0A9J6HDY2_HAELO|nr:hypothetical protein HPB48_027091 [Haemaphysalis longicornis]
MLKKITGEVENALRMFRRILNRNRGISEECAIRLIHAFVLCHISYFAAMLNWKKTVEERLDTMIRLFFKVALGLPINASTDLLKLGVHNTFSEIAEAQHAVQVGRLSGTREGRDILVTLGFLPNRIRRVLNTLAEKSETPSWSVLSPEKTTLSLIKEGDCLAPRHF